MKKKTLFKRYMTPYYGSGHLKEYSKARFGIKKTKMQYSNIRVFESRALLYDTQRSSERSEAVLGGLQNSF